MPTSQRRLLRRKWHGLPKLADVTSNTVRIGDLFGAGSQAWAASDVWAIWKADVAASTAELAI